MGVVCLFDFQQDCTKTTSPIFMKVAAGCGMGKGKTHYILERSSLMGQLKKFSGIWDWQRVCAQQRRTSLNSVDGSPLVTKHSQYENMMTLLEKYGAVFADL